MCDIFCCMETEGLPCDCMIEDVCCQAAVAFLRIVLDEHLTSSYFSQAHRIVHES